MRARRGRKDGPRRGTAGKSRTFSAMTVVVGVLMLAQMTFLSRNLVRRVEARVLDGPAVEQPADAAPFTPGLRGGRIAVREARPWPEGGAETDTLKAVAALLWVLAAALFFLHHGGGGRELYQAGGTMEWLFTFPAPASSLFLSRILVAATVQPLAWLGLFPLLLGLLYERFGRLEVALPLALAGALYIALVVAAVAVASEAWARRRLSPGRTRNLQAGGAVLGLLAIYVTLFPAVSESLPGWLVPADWMPARLLWLGPALPVLFAGRAVSAGLVGGAMAATGLAVLVLATQAAALAVRGGLMTSSGAAPSRRRRRRPGPFSRLTQGLRGMTRKELLLYLRDRTLLVQTLVVPAMIIGFQVAIHPAVLRTARERPPLAASFAFAVAAYMLVFIANTLVSSEGKGMWMLYTLPRPLSAAFRAKTRFWAGLTTLYGLLCYLLILQRPPSLDPEGVIASCLLLIGVPLFAYVACGLGALHVDPSARQPKRNLSIGAAYLYLLLAGGYGWVLYTEGWVLLKAFAPGLVALVAAAIWQRVEDQADWLLDPVARPVPRLGIAEGLVAVFLFLVLQVTVAAGVALGAEADLGVSPGLLATVTYGLVGGGGVAVLLAWLAHRAPPHLRRSLGLVRGRGVATGLVVGVALGLVAAAVDLGYPRLVAAAPALGRWDALPGVPGHRLLLGLDPTWQWPTLCILVPLLEEVLFRGIVYGAVRRSLPATGAILATALAFALAHPPAEMVPALALGVLAGGAREFTQGLLAPTILHGLALAAVVLAHAGVLGA